jgi:hypothetical protein
MECFLKVGLDLQPEKYKFHKYTVKYLRHIILTQGILMDHNKVDMVYHLSYEKMTVNG